MRRARRSNYDPCIISISKKLPRSTFWDAILWMENDNIMFKILFNGGLWARVELRISFQNKAIFHFRSWLWDFRVWNVSTYFASYFLNENVAQSNYITYITTFLKPLDSSFLRDNDDFVFLRLLWHCIILNLRPSFEIQHIIIMHYVVWRFSTVFWNSKMTRRDTLGLDRKIYGFRLLMG